MANMLAGSSSPCLAAPYLFVSPLTRRPPAAPHTNNRRHKWALLPSSAGVIKSKCLAYTLQFEVRYTICNCRRSAYVLKKCHSLLSSVSRAMQQCTVSFGTSGKTVSVACWAGSVPRGFGFLTLHLETWAYAAALCWYQHLSTQCYPQGHGYGSVQCCICTN